MINTSILIIVITRLPRTSAASLFPLSLSLASSPSHVAGNTFQIDVAVHRKS